MQEKSQKWNENSYYPGGTGAFSTEVKQPGRKPEDECRR